MARRREGSAARALSTRVVARLEADGVPASQLVDMAVYRAAGCLRLLGSSKLAGGAPLALAAEDSHEHYRRLDEHALLLQSLVQPAHGARSVATHASATPVWATVCVQAPAASQGAAVPSET